MPSDFTDTAAQSGRAFSGEAICGASGASPVKGNAMLWNPYGSGRTLILDRLTWATGTLAGSGYQGADIRSVTDLTGYSLFGADHVADKSGQDNVAKGLIYTKDGNAPANYPFNRPHEEFWTSRLYETKSEDFGGVPHIIPQGRGKSFNEAFGGQWIVSFFWREIDAEVIEGPPPPPPPPGALTGTAIGDMLNQANFLDNNDATAASSNGDTLSVTVGLDLGSGNSSALSRFVIKSPTGRSFCSASPPRSLTWAHSYSADGVNFTAGATGSFTDTANTTQSILDISQSFPAGRAHKIKLTSTSVADWRVAGLALYA